jgi:hypothetical protein
VTAWEALAMQKKVPKEGLPVIFEDVQIFQAVQGDVAVPVTLSVLLDRSNRFQVYIKQAKYVAALQATT